VFLSGRPSDWKGRSSNEQWLGALLLSAVLFSSLSAVFRMMPSAKPVTGSPGPAILSLARILMKDWALPFEILSLVLLAALVGAVYFTRPDQERKGGGPW
ncbi:MAG TPA: NADH-quinone oxidoreductase subunit J, partial [Elusimicrobiota bacterium]|nr:NADH-quinone oxidoreductase subunit J [Elusimicrobiota bacterium]